MTLRPEIRPALLCLTDNRFWLGGYGSSQRILEMLSGLSREWQVAVFFPGILSEKDGWHAVHLCPWLRLHHQGGMFAEGELIRRPQQLADAVRAHRPRVLMAEYFWMTPHIQACPAELLQDTLLVLDTHDVMHRRSDAFKNRGVEYWIQSTREEEKYWLEHFDLLIAIQDEEAAVLREMADRPVITTMHGRAIDPLPLPPPGGPFRLGVFSSRGASQVHSLQQFLVQTWPVLHAAHPAVELHVFGHVAGRLEEASVPAGVRLRGFVPDLRQAYASLHAVINPATLASGLQIKSVEALCLGRTLLSTSLGLKGMPSDVASCEAVISCADDESWSRAIGELVHDAARLRQRSATAADFARRHFAREPVYAALSRELRARSVTVQAHRPPDLQTCLAAATQAFSRVTPIKRARSIFSDPVVVAGTGPRARLLHAGSSEELNVCAYVDLDPGRHGSVFLGRPVFPPHVLQSGFAGTIIVADEALRPHLSEGTRGAKVRDAGEYLRDFALAGSGPLLELALSCGKGREDVPVIRSDEVTEPELAARALACGARRIVIADRDHARIASALQAAGFGADRLGVFHASIFEPIVIFGTGRAAEEAWNGLEDKSAVIAFADNDARKHGLRFHGRPIVAPAQLRDLPFRRICIASMYYQKITGQLVALGIEEGRIDVFEIRQQRSALQAANVLEEIRQAAAILAPLSPADVATLAFAGMFADSAHIAWFDARAAALAFVLRHAGCQCTVSDAAPKALLATAGLETASAPGPTCSLIVLRDGQQIPAAATSSSRMARFDDAGAINWTLQSDDEEAHSVCERQAG